MPSLLSGYEYDIFISYRQKDNKHDGWVTKFVENLKGEIEATFKEDITIYFDENPHDRLQDTHDVERSLEGKLKCLIFIPILSQTYCDPNSYAWQYEFLAFIKLANADRLGRNIRLRNGNFASRVLPIRIHDLEQEDIRLFEKETGSVLRAMDFVFKTSSGVNRPLQSNEDRPNDNLNKTLYRDQINKVANAIKEIITGLKAIEATATEAGNIIQQREPEKEIWKEITGEKQPASFNIKNKYLSGVLITAIIVIALAMLLIPKLFRSNSNVVKDPDGKISIAVNNFNDNSADTAMANLKIAIPDILRNDLANSEELLVQNSQTMFELYQSMGQNQKASIVPSVSRDAALKLKTGTFVTGSFQNIRDTILILAELNDTRSGDVIWSGNVKGTKENYPYLSLSLSAQLKNFLEIKALKKQINPEFSEAFTSSPEAYRKYIEGMQLMMKMKWPAALQSFQDAYKIDTTFSLAAFYTAYLYCYQASDFQQVSIWTQKSYNVREKLPYDLRCWIEMWETCQYVRNLDDIIKSCDVLELSESRSRYYWWDLGVTYEDCEVFDKSLKAFEKVEEITNEWGEEWKYPDYYWRFGWTLHNVGFHEKEAKILEKGLNLFPDLGPIIWIQAVCAISREDTAQESQLLTKAIKKAKDVKVSESEIERSLGDVYFFAKSFDKAEEHYRKALKSDPNNPSRMNTLTLFLIHNNRNIDEADSLSKRVLEIRPESPAALWTQGLVCYEHGKFKEALELIQHSKDLGKTSWNTVLEKDLKKVREAITHQDLK
jgi:tetratricopeptide (TPR) repeat protein